MQAGWLLAARGRLRLAELRPAAALSDLLAAGDLFDRLRVFTPSGASWRSDAALAHLALAAPTEARALAAAQNLFVTARTVEGHLTHAYQKLAITSREQLAAALTLPDNSARTPTSR